VGSESRSDVPLSVVNRLEPVKENYSAVFFVLPSTIFYKVLVRGTSSIASRHRVMVSHHSESAAFRASRNVSTGFDISARIGDEAG
jgi:hypothetical protein